MAATVRSERRERPYKSEERWMGWGRRRDRAAYLLLAALALLRVLWWSNGVRQNRHEIPDSHQSGPQHEHSTHPADCRPFINNRSAISLSCVSFACWTRFMKLTCTVPSATLSNLQLLSITLSLRPASQLHQSPQLTDKALEKSSKYPAKLKPTCSRACFFASA